jgi:pimeloyl-ACP methyl ester carboxylesterase
LHASDLYGTAYAVADLAAILGKLQTGPVTVYGDSYGSWFTQAFIARHPTMVRNVILDSTYYLRGLSPWYESSLRAGNRAMNLVCFRDIACDDHNGMDASARFAELVTRVRQQPIAGTTREANGKPVHQTISPRQLADLLQDSGSDPVILREIDASVRAAMHGDNAPLLRLVAQEQAYNHGSESAVYFDDALYMAVSCTDYPQLFDMRSSPATRARQFAHAVAARPRWSFAPFTVPEWVSQSGYSQPYDVCLDWPSPVHHAPIVPARRTVLPASKPILVVGGDVDDLTPLSDVEQFAHTLGRTVRVVALSDTVHVTSEGDTFLSAGADCARSIIDRFVADPTKLLTMDILCAFEIPPIHTPGEYPRTFRSIPLRSMPLNRGRGSASIRRAAWLASQTAADAAIRYYYAYSNGPGLRGGGFTAKPGRHGAVRFTLHADRFVSDAYATGSFTWNSTTTALQGTILVHVAGTTYRVRVAWRQRLDNDQTSQDANAWVTGTHLTLWNPGP